MNDEFELPFPQYRCPACGKDLPLGEARMTVTCASHMRRENVEFTVRGAGNADSDAIALLCERALGETDVDVFGRTFDVLSGSNLIAEANGAKPRCSHGGVRLEGLQDRGSGIIGS